MGRSGGWTLAFAWLGVILAVPGQATERPLLKYEGVSAPALWAFGMKEPEEMGKYRRAGFNTLWVEVKPEEGASETYARLRPLLVAAAREGVGVIVCLRFDLLRPKKGPLCPRNPEYVRACEKFAEEAIPVFRRLPNLVAWATGNRIEVEYNTPAFRSFLAEAYRDIRMLNRAWGSNFPSFERLDPAVVPFLDRPKPWGIGRATLDFAIYQMRAQKELVATWARLIRKYDSKGRPIIAGRPSHYRDLVLTPSECQFALTNPDPYRFMLDLSTCDAFAVRVASQAGTTGALHVIPLRKMPQANPRALASWVVEAFLNGASGVGVDDWETLKRNPSLLKAFSEVSRWAKRELWAREMARPCAAILYEPFSPGVMVGKEREGEFGFIPQLGTGEPIPLFAAFSRGTPFGPVDVFGELLLPRLKLDSYSVIFCPLAIFVGKEDFRALADYVGRGGVVCADLGFGSYHSLDGTLFFPAPPIPSFLGVEATLDVLDTSGDFLVVEGHPLFPSLPPGRGTSGGAFPPPLAIVTLGLGAHPFGLIRAGPRGTYYPNMAGVVITRHGAGYVVYCSARMWANWSPHDPTFWAFHGDLLRRRATLEARGREIFAAWYGSRIVVWGREGARQTAQLTIPFRPQLPKGHWLTVAAGQSRMRLPLTIPVVLKDLRPVVVEFAPVWAESPHRPLYVLLEVYDSREVGLRLSVAGGWEAQVEVTISDGAYPVEPGSKHRIVVEPARGKAREMTVKAKGRVLRFRLRLREAKVRVERERTA